ncbi:hypothetical protein ACFQU5_10690 [Ureibacillus sp. GCM10028918]
MLTIVGEEMNNSIKILVIEDDEDINILLCNIASQNGYSAKAAYSGRDSTTHFGINCIKRAFPTRICSFFVE